MTEKTMDITAVSAYLTTKLQVTRVKLRENDHVITITPAENAAKNPSCPFLGIAADSTLTVDKFLDWKREERAVEHENDLRS